MKKTTKKAMLLVATAAMLVTGIAGCAGCGGNEATNPTIVPTVTEKPVEATEAPKKAVTPTEVPAVNSTVESEVTAAPTEESTLALASTPVPIATAIPEPTVTSTPTPSSEPTATPTSVPTSTPMPKTTSTPKPTSTPTPSPSPTPTPTPVKGIKAGDYVIFGSYEQDNDLSNGKEPIEWLVLDTEEGKAFLLAKYCLDAQAFDSNYDAQEETEAIRNGKEYNYSVTWDKSTLRTWLNSEFYKTAFTAEARESILLSDVENLPNSRSKRSSGADTKDYVYLLSESEVLNYFGEEWVLEYFDVYGEGPEKREHLGIPTEYALAQEVYTRSTSTYWYANYCGYWLRTAGAVPAYTETVGEGGFLERAGGFSDHTRTGIRPVVWINVASADIEKAN